MNGYKPGYSKPYYYANMGTDDYWYSVTFIKTGGIYAYAFLVYDRFVRMLHAE